jgi:hypothetical protein
LKTNLETNNAAYKIHQTVIPAKAGIQFLYKFRVAGKAVFMVLPHFVRII